MYTKANTQNTLYNTRSTLFYMHKGDTESNNSCLERPKTKIQTVELVKVKRIFYAQKLMKVNNPYNPTATEIYNEWDKLKYILFLHRSYEGIYRKVIQYLK